MFNIGGGEFLVIALIALIVLGPQRLPDAARQVGKAMGELRRLSNGFQNEMRDAFTDVDSPPAPASRRDVLGGTSAPSQPVSDAVAAVSHQSAPRRAPLKAGPAAEEAQSPEAARPVRAPAAKHAPPRTSAVKRAAPPKRAPAKNPAPGKGTGSDSKAPQPRSKGS
jgi:sec-independent protein translocase protein TatB